MTDTMHTAVTDNRAAEKVTPTVWRHGVIAGLAAAVTTTVVATVGQWSGISLAIAGEAIPLVAFAQLTLIGALIGIVLAAAAARRSARPRTTFVRTTVLLTAASIVPDLVVDADTATRALLVATHVVAAAIIVPSLARRLRH